jgi:uncharacterized protein YaiE (UPF0345 family)
MAGAAVSEDTFQVLTERQEDVDVCKGAQGLRRQGRRDPDRLHAGRQWHVSVRPANSDTDQNRLAIPGAYVQQTMIRIKIA